MEHRHSKQVRAKKHLGQHFLNDESIAEAIVKGLSEKDSDTPLTEIGPGMGVLTKYLSTIYGERLSVFEIDTESVAYLIENNILTEKQIFGEDFLKANLSERFQGSFNIIGNFPYNISSPIFFKILEYRSQIPWIVCMLQKEVAERIASPHGSKKYGILSVFMQAFYRIEYLLTVPPEVFTPPPKVDSGVIRLEKYRDEIPCDEKLFFQVVKASFNNRRKTLRNSLKKLNLSLDNVPEEVLGLRPEQLDVEAFITLTKQVSTEN